jgi:cell division protease FtsH
MLLYLVFLGLLFYLFRAGISDATEVDYAEFLADLRAGRITEVEIGETAVTGRRGAGADPGENIRAERIPGMDIEGLIEDLESRGIPYRGRFDTDTSWLYLLVWVLPLILILSYFGFSARRQMQSGPFGFMKSRAKIHDQYQQSDVTFKDVAGVDEAEAELVEVVDFLKNPQRYTGLGGRIPKGVLLVGPPGTGKTLLARAVSGEAGVPFFSISGSEFMEMFVGVGAARVRDLFEQGKRRAPCIIFIDELDAIGKSRSAARGFYVGHDEREQTLNQLLAEMDGFDTSRGVILMAATNTPEVLDPALLRAGRFDRQVLVGRPDLSGRRAILEVHAAGVKLDPAVDLGAVASRTPGMVGADLANIVNEAALLAARRGGTDVSMRDFEEAIDRVTLGPEKKGRFMSAEEKARVAHHEAGHALVALNLEHVDPVHRVSIIPRAIGALGHTLQLPTEERFLLTKPELEDRLAVMMGGRAAETIAYAGEISTGATNDLERASELARQMVMRFGMGQGMGHLAYGRPVAGRFVTATWTQEERNYSEETARLIDQEVHRIVDEAYDRAHRILEAHAEALERIARELVERETLERARIDELLGRDETASA